LKFWQKPSLIMPCKWSIPGASLNCGGDKWERDENAVEAP